MWQSSVCLRLKGLCACVCAQMVSGYCEVKESKGKRISSVKGEKHMRTKCSATVSIKSLLYSPQVCLEFI